MFLRKKLERKKLRNQSPCWHCGQDGHYAWTCGDKYKRQSQTQPSMETEGLPAIHAKKES